MNRDNAFDASSSISDYSLKIYRQKKNGPIIIKESPRIRAIKPSSMRLAFMEGEGTRIGHKIVVWGKLKGG